MSVSIDYVVRELCLRAATQLLLEGMNNRVTAGVECGLSTKRCHVSHRLLLSL